MFVVVTIEAQQFPVTTVKGVVTMIMILVMHSEFSESLAVKLAATTATNPWVHFKCPLSIVFVLVSHFVYPKSKYIKNGSKIKEI